MMKFKLNKEKAEAQMEAQNAAATAPEQASTVTTQQTTVKETTMNNAKSTKTSKDKQSRIEALRQQAALNAENPLSA